MPKRKLSELNDPALSRDGKTRKLSAQAVRLTHNFDHGTQLLSRALKTARGFERQKLSRREKTAKSQDDSTTLARLTDEVEALKGLNYHVTAARYLFKQLSKTKRIAESLAFKEFSESRHISTDGPKRTAEANVLARLFKSNPVKNVMPDIMAGIRKLLRLEEVPAGKDIKPGTKKDTPQKENAGHQRQEKFESESASEGLPRLKEEKLSTFERSEQLSRSEEDSSVSGDDKSEGEDFSRFDARLASDSGSEVNSEPGEDTLHGGIQANAVDDISDSVSRSASPSFSAADSPPPKKANPSKSSTTPAQSTTFLPSLMMGGYWSGSESEATDDEGVTGDRPQRKNRMGQQARRALWEKKYGTKANHIQKERKQQKHNRDSGWDTRRGAMDRSGGGKGDKRGGRGEFSAGAGHPHHGSDSHGHRGPHSSSGPIHAGKGKGPSTDNGPLHPSWEAKRRAKEQASAASFQGKKVVFD